MAETTETVVFEVDVSSYEKSLADLTKSINTLKTSQKELQKQTQEGAEGAAESLEKVNAELKVQQQQYRTTQNVLVGYIGAKQKEVNVTDFAKNSIQANRDLLKQLTAQYINTKSPSEQFTKQIKTLSDTLKQQEGVIGDTRRNVGNYFNEFAKGVPVLGQVIDPLRGIAKGFSESGISAAGFQSALLAGIPLIIGGIQGIVSIMQKFDSVTEGLEDTMAGVNQAFDFFVGHGNDGSLTDLVNGMTDAYNAGVQLSQVMRELAEAQDRQSVLNAKSNKEVEALILQSKDRTKTEQDRIKLLDEASAKEKKNLEENLALAKEREQLAGNELRRVIEAGLADDKAKKELNASARDRINLERESQNLQEKILNRRNALLDEIRQNEEKVKQAQIKRTDDEKKESDKRIAQAQKEADEKLRIEQKHAQDVSNLEIEFALTDRQRLEDSFAAKQALLNANNEEELALINTIETAKQEALKQYDEKLIEQNAKTLATITSQYSTSAKEQTEIEKNAFEEKKQIKEAELSFASTISNGLIGLVRNVADATGASAAFNKVLALVEIGTQTAIALATGIASSQNLPYPGNLVAMGSTIAAVLGAIGSAFAILSKTPEAPKPSFAEGGRVLDIGGRSHADGGTPIHVNGQYVAEAEAGEGMFIMKKDAYRDIEMLSGWNQKYGGRSWGNSTRFAADGGSISLPTSDGGFSTREISNNVNNSLSLKQMLGEVLANAPAPELSIVELNNKQNSRRRSISISEAG